MPIGRPLSLTPNTTNRDLSVTATAGQTSFTVTGGYRINQIDVFRNGVKLSNITDFTAVDGSTVVLADAAVLNDEISFEILDDFNVSNAIVSAASTQTVFGNLNVAGELFSNEITLQNAVFPGIMTSGGTANLNQSVHTGVATFSAAGDFNSTISVAQTATFSSDVSIAGTLTYEDVNNIDSVGLITARSGIDIDTGITLRSPSANVFTLGTNSTERFRITSAGNIGIGSDNPEGRLNVAGDGVKIHLSDTDTALSDGELSSAIEFAQNDSSDPNSVNASIRAIGDGSIGNLALAFHTGQDNEAVRIDANGKAWYWYK